MSERKVLNKYYPPDFDPNNIPRLRLPKTRQYTVRIMTPCNMKCNTCGDYIAKAKKFNARKETVDGEDYLGLKIFRFYFKCPTCMAEITFKTDPKTCDYELEHGATRNFQALRMAEQQADKEAKDKELDEKLNPMKMLENRTKSSRKEMEELEALEELKEISQRQVTMDTEEFLGREKLRKQKYEEMCRKLEEEEDEKMVKKLLGQQNEDGPSNQGEWVKVEDSKEFIQVNSPSDESRPHSDLKKTFDTSFKKPFVTNTEKNIPKKKLAQLVRVVKKVKAEPEKPALLNSLCDYSDSD